MLRRLALKNVGPAGILELADMPPRFNLLTGDNGLGKSFLLETAWWALTRTWHETQAVPSAPDASIDFDFDGEAGVHTSQSAWVPETQTWPRGAGRPPNPGLVLYARIDGSFSVWDPARNYRLYTRRDGSNAESPRAFQFTRDEVMNGLTRMTTGEGGTEQEERLCAGLIDDWSRWQQSQDPRFELLQRLLSHVGPDDQPLLPGALTRPQFSDVRDIPTITMPYGQDVPLTYAPAGVRRMAKLAYLLAWALSEHERAAKLIGIPRSNQVIVLIDEPETHLHPKWQRTVVPSLIRAVEEWHHESDPRVQMVVATHSPLVLASMESVFDPEKDALWKLDLVDGEVVVERDAWDARGDVNTWLESDVFDLGHATSRKAETALKSAEALFDRKGNVTEEEARAAHAALVAAIPAMDPFFTRFRYYFGDLLGDEA